MKLRSALLASAMMALPIAAANAQAIELVNSSRYGNGTSIFTESGAAARRAAR